MTRIEGHPPAADYGPEIHLPDSYDGADWTPCPVCDGDADDACLCTDCLADLADSEAERWADVRRDER